MDDAALDLGNMMCTEEGSYGDITPFHRNIVTHSWPKIRDLLGSIPFIPGRGPFVICDYGTADGINSIGLMTNCIAEWVQTTYGEEQQVQIIYEDQPKNDCNALIRVIEGESSGSRSFLRDHQNVYVTYCGRSFFKQCLPDKSVHLGISTNALSWLSTCPRVTSPEVFSMHFSEGSAEHRLFVAQSAKDWNAFLHHRAKELVPGGRLLIVTIGRTCPCNEHGSNKWCVYRAMTDIWRDMMQEKVISQEEFLATIEPGYWHRAEDLLTPFDANGLCVSAEGLRLLVAETQKIKTTWQEISTTTTDLATLIVRSFRALSNGMFKTGLSSKRKMEDRMGIIDELFRRLHDEVAQAPADRLFDPAMHFVAMAKSAEE